MKWTSLHSYQLLKFCHICFLSSLSVGVGVCFIKNNTERNPLETADIITLFSYTRRCHRNMGHFLTQTKWSKLKFNQTDLIFFNLDNSLSFSSFSQVWRFQAKSFGSFIVFLWLDSQSSFLDKILHNWCLSSVHHFRRHRMPVCLIIIITIVDI